MDSAELKHERRLALDRVLEVIVVFLLSIAGVAASWSGHQASLWSSSQASFNAQALAVRLEATRHSTEAGQVKIVDISMFMQWLSAHAEKKSELEDFYRTHFRAEFKPAFEAWRASVAAHKADALPTPFVSALYTSVLQEKATEMNARADKMLVEGEMANRNSDKYSRNTVIMAMVMFFSGITRHFPSRWVQIMLVLFAIAVAIIGMANLFIYPVARAL